MNKNNKAFSLIELLVALSILAVVAAIIVPKFLNVRSQAAATTGIAQLQELKHVYQNFLGVGGTGTANAGDVIRFISNSAANRAAINGVSDSTGTLNSSNISINLGSILVQAAAPASQAAANALAQGWYTTTAAGGASAYYSDGQGDVWRIDTTPSDLTATQLFNGPGVALTNIN